LPPAFKLVSCSAYSSTVKMETISSSETSVDFKRTTRRYVPQDSTLHDHRCENLKSCIHKVFNIFLPNPKVVRLSNSLNFIKDVNYPAFLVEICVLSVIRWKKLSWLIRHFSIVNYSPMPSIIVCLSCPFALKHCFSVAILMWGPLIRLGKDVEGNGRSLCGSNAPVSASKGLKKATNLFSQYSFSTNIRTGYFPGNRIAIATLGVENIVRNQLEREILMTEYKTCFKIAFCNQNSCVVER
jgi:hypothetical protein